MNKNRKRRIMSSEMLTLWNVYFLNLHIEWRQFKNKSAKERE